MFASGPDGTLFAETGPFRVAAHCHPVWKVVLSAADCEQGIRWSGPRAPVASAGVLVPPGFRHGAAASSAYTALFLVPWMLPPGAAGPTPLDRRTVDRVLAALGQGRRGAPSDPREADLAAARAELTRLTGAPPRLDPRVAHVFREVTRAAAPEATVIGPLAADVGLSPVRLRALVREAVGVPLVRIRQWVRLRAAVAALPDGTVAAAAGAAGFADQAHLARTSREFIGRPPVSLGRVGAPGR